MRNFSRFLAAAAGIACAASLAFAVDKTILGKKLTVKGGDPSKRKVSTTAKEKASPDTLVGNPTLTGSAGGAILTIFVNGASSSSGAFTLPQGTRSNGKPFWSAINGGYRYKDPKGENGLAVPAAPVKSVLIKKTPNGSFSIKAKLSGKNGTITVVPPGQDVDNEGCVALKLGQSAGAGDRYSVSFGAGDKFVNATNKFKAIKKTTIQVVCPVVTTSTTTSSSTTSLPTLPSTTTTTTSSTTTTSMYGSPSRAFLAMPVDLLD